jgi:hypothetical protein
MSILLVTYDLNKAGQDYDGFYKIIKSFNYTKLSESSYAIQTDETPAKLYEKLFPHIDKNDHFYVITLKKPYSGFGPTDVNNWLDKNLTF